MTERPRSSEGDGRNVDESVGILAGEGAAQRAPSGRATAEGAAPAAVWEGRPHDARGDGVTYYERPLLKDPVWIWAVPAYFYAGGAAGAAAVLGAVARRSGDPQLAGLARRCRTLAAAGTVAGTGLLVYDLGRPARFLNMLRVFRPTSPLNVGSWVLAIMTPAAVVSAVAAGDDGWSGFAGNGAEAVTALLGLPLAAYTAVLLSNTAVPVWQESRRALPALFVASAVSGAAGLLELADATEAERRAVRAFGLLGRIGELVASIWVEREAGRVERVGRPLREGVAGAMLKAAQASTAAAVALALLPGRGRAQRVATGVLGSAGAALVKFGIFYAGRPSTADPRASFELQRAGRE
jgi:DMSO reductase anchor subunit